jgi:aminomethyltransferase
LLLEERGMLRNHQPVLAEAQSGTPGARVGEITSGTFSPTLNRAIALARVRRDVPARVLVEIRGQPHAARIVKPPFVRNGKVLIEL